MKARSVYSFFSRDIFLLDLSKMGRAKAAAYRALQLFAAAGREYLSGRLGLHATSFVYTTLLSIVPLIAVSFSVLKAFGAHSLADPLLRRFLAPLGDAGTVITARIIQFVGNLKVGVLGALGLVFLIYTVVSLIYKMETSLNGIWRVKESRSISRRFSEYISVMLVGPILIFAAMGITAAAKSSTFMQEVLSIGPIGALYYHMSSFVPFIITCIAFTFTYVFIPNTKVKVSSALVGGVFAGALWEILGWAFTTFVVKSASYSAVYSGFAILLVFMMWVYYSWLTFLAGAVISFYFQRPEYMAAPEGEYRLSASGREALAAAVMLLVGDSHYHGNTPWTQKSISGRLGLPGEPVQDITGILKGAGFLAEAGPDSARYLLPARDIETIKVRDIIEAIRRAGHKIRPVGEAEKALSVSSAVDEAIGGALGEETVKDLVLGRREEGKKKAA